MNNSTFSYLNFIHFSKLNLWDVKRHLLNLDIYNNDNYVLLRDILTNYKVSLNKKDIKQREIHIISKINFSGQLYLRPLEDIDSFKSNLFEIPNESLIYSKINVRHGCTFYNNTGKTIAGTSEYPVFIINKNKVRGEYLQKVLRTSYIKRYLDTKTTGFSKTRVPVDEFLNIKIPLPSLEKQKEIVDRYNEKIKLAEEQEKEAQNLEEMIEQYICSELKIVNTSPKVSNEFKISFVNYKDLSRWGVEFLKNNLSSKDFLKSLVYPMKKLGTLVAINPDNDFSKLDENLEMTFLPMASISDKFGEIVNAEKGKNGDSNGYTKFKEGDLLWAKITPCMQNGKSAIAKNLINNRGYGSTEFYVIRNKNENELYFDYIYHLLRTKIIRETATKYFTGSSGQQRVPKSFLENLSIPLPDFYKQKQISDELYKIKHKIKELTYTAEQNRQLAQEEFEKELFE